MQALQVNKKILILLVFSLVVLGGVYYQDILAIFGLTTAATVVKNPTTPNGSQLTDNAHDSVKKIEEDTVSGQLEYQNSQEVSVQKDEVKAILQLLPSKLQELRDPFKDPFASTDTESSTASVNQQTSTINQDNISTSVKQASSPVGEQNLTYEDLFKQSKDVKDGQKSIGGQSSGQTPGLSSREPIIQYPPFELKGLVSQGGRQKAILAVKGQSFIVSEGDQIEDWQVAQITQDGVLVTNPDAQRFRVSLEGVMIDEKE